MTITDRPTARPAVDDIVVEVFLRNWLRRTFDGDAIDAEIDRWRGTRTWEHARYSLAAAQPWMT